MDRELLYKRCVEFHGHSCGGLMIGFRAALCAMEQLGIEAPSCDEEIICIAENDACGIDAIQLLLGCTTGKGNLILRLRGKQAFSFFSRKSGKSLRIVLKERKFSSHEGKMRFMRDAHTEEIFSIESTPFEAPQYARIFKSRTCDQCGELTAEPWLRVKDGKLLCLDCYQKSNDM